MAFKLISLVFIDNYEKKALKLVNIIWVNNIDSIFALSGIRNFDKNFPKKRNFLFLWHILCDINYVTWTVHDGLELTYCLKFECSASLFMVKIENTSLIQFLTLDWRISELSYLFPGTLFPQQAKLLNWFLRSKMLHVTCTMNHGPWWIPILYSLYTTIPRYIHQIFQLKSPLSETS